MQAELKIIFDNMDDLARWVYSFNASSASTGQAATTDTAQPRDAAVVSAEVAAAPVSAQAESDAAAPAKRTRRTKAEMAAAAQESAAPADPTPVTTAEALLQGPLPLALDAINAEALRELFNKVNAKYGAEGLQKVGDIVKQFSVVRISELKPDQYAAAAAACEAALV